MNLPLLLCLFILLLLTYRDWRGEKRQKLKYEPLKKKK
jgi:hypothetical protein